MLSIATDTNVATDAKWLYFIIHDFLMQDDTFREKNNKLSNIINLLSEYFLIYTSNVLSNIYSLFIINFISL